MNLLGTVHTFFALDNAIAFQQAMGHYGYVSRIRVTGRAAYTVHIIRMLDDNGE